MKRIISVIVAAAVLLGLAAVPASAAVPLPAQGCIFTAAYPLAFDNGLAWSDSDQEAFHTPMFRAGDCRHVMVHSLGVYNGPPCFNAKVKTYNENGTVRVQGPWIQLASVNMWRDLRPTIDEGRLHRVYVAACGAFRDRYHPPSLEIYSR